MYYPVGHLFLGRCLWLIVLLITDLIISMIKKKTEMEQRAKTIQKRQKLMHLSE
jgi:hypothetical protein